MNSQLNEKKSLELIFKGLRARRDIDFSSYREGTIKRRLSRRMAATGCDNYKDYFDYLEKNQEEYGRLFMDLTIKVSRFFRNRAVFEILSDKIFPDIMSAKESKNDRTLRIWCAGCSFGEEVYSIAITLVEYLKKHGKKIDDYNISIFGTDIDDKALERAKEGVYNTEAVKEINNEILDSYFILSKAANFETPTKFRPHLPSYLVVESIKNMVNFSRHDLTSETKMSPPAGIVANYDLILCRNLLIYFSEPLQKRAFSNLFNSLNPGCYLILGKSESIPEFLKPFLVKQNPQHKIYKKI
ncbi:MAG: protein-glutamate O-methyltransferase CheR [Candidatus Desulfaltia sp.]|nr:protein-glutamate O-methyltransferase CheR [Candidatus Desulfaltia sp.]